MKKSLFVTLGPICLLILILALACGSSTNTPKVNTPSSQPLVSTETTAPTAPEPTKAIGTSRENPAPIGSEIVSDKVSYTIIEVVRPANDIVIKGNMFNTTPEPAKEYIFVKVKVACQKSTDEKCTVSPFNFKLVNSTGNVIDSEIIVAGVSGLLESSDLFGGASVEGYLPFIIDKEEKNPLLYFDSFFGDDFYMQVIN